MHPYPSGFLITSYPIFLGYTLWILNLVWICSYLYENPGYLFPQEICLWFWVMLRSQYSVFIHYGWWLAILSPHSQATPDRHKCESQTCYVSKPMFCPEPGKELRHPQNWWKNESRTWFFVVPLSLCVISRQIILVYSLKSPLKYILITNLWVLSWF